MRRLLPILLYLLLASPGYAAVAFDAVSTGTYEGSASPFEFSWSHTVGAGSNRYIRVGICYPADAITVSSIVFGAQNFSLVSSTSRAELWELIAPNTGTDTILVTMAASQNVVGGAISFSGVDQSTPSGTPVTAESGDPTSVSITVPANGLASDVMCATSNPTLTAGASQTERYNLANGGANITGAGSTQTTSGTMEWSGSGASGVGLVAVPINPATTTTVVRRRPIRF